MTVGDLRKRLAEYSDDDIVLSESRGDYKTDPSVYDNAYMDDRDEESYYDSKEEALEDGVPEENIKRQVLVTGHS
jgi:hypothetical protein